MATALIFEPGEMGNKNSSKRSRPLNQVDKNISPPLYNLKQSYHSRLTAESKQMH
jgi:hypothetical protein